MNATIWVTLSNFVQYLGRTNQCTIDKTPKGWYIQYVDNTPEARMRAAAQQALEEGEVSAERRHAVQLQRAIAECKKDGGFQESEFTELQRKEGDAPIAFSMSASASSASASSAIASASANAALAAKAPEGEKKKNVLADPKKNVLADAFEGNEEREIQDSKKRKLSTVEKIRLEHEEAKQKKLRQDAPDSPSESSSSGSEPWLCEGIIVKVMHPDLAGGKYYRKKGKVMRVREQFAAEIRMLEGRDLIRLDQEMLETVIPNLGKAVMVVKGPFRGKSARMKTVDLEGFCVSVELDDSRVVENLKYDQVCKIEDSWSSVPKKDSTWLEILPIHTNTTLKSIYWYILI